MCAVGRRPSDDRWSFAKRRRRARRRRRRLATFGACPRLAVTCMGRPTSCPRLRDLVAGFARALSVARSIAAAESVDAPRPAVAAPPKPAPCCCPAAPRRNAKKALKGFARTREWRRRFPRALFCNPHSPGAKDLARQRARHARLQWPRSHAQVIQLTFGSTLIVQRDAQRSQVSPCVVLPSVSLARAPSQKRASFFFLVHCAQKR